MILFCRFIGTLLVILFATAELSSAYPAHRSCPACTAAPPPRCHRSTSLEGDTEIESRIHNPF